MGDLKTNWKDPGVPIPDMAGDGIVARGGDPNIAAGSVKVGGALVTHWPDDEQAVIRMESTETPNSVSGMPTQPSRFAPSGEPPEPPNLKDRNPGMVDKK